MKQLKSTLKLRTIFQRASIPGLSFIIKSESNTRKVVWIIILLLGILICSYQIYKFFDIYLSYPVVISFGENQNDQLTFPAVTICNINRMKDEYSRCRNEDIFNEGCQRFYGASSGRGISERRETMSCTNLRNGNVDDGVQRKIKFLTYFTRKDSATRQFIGYKALELIKNCNFNSEKCFPEDFVHFQSLKYGNCFTFNKHRENRSTLKTSSIGYLSGLEIFLNLGLDLYAIETANIGIRVSVHDPSEIPNPEEHGVNVAPGFETSISLKQTTIHRLPAPYRDHCMNYRSFENNHKNEEECIKFCLQHHYLSNCGCVDPTITAIPEWRQCAMDNVTSVCCLDEVQDKLMNQDQSCDCKVACDTTYYNEQVSYALWPSENISFLNKSQDDYIKYLNQYRGGQITQDSISANNESKRFSRFLRKHFAKVKIYYSTLATSGYSQMPMFEDSEIFSHLGGELSLWLGLSIFVLFELIEIAIYFIARLK